MNLGMYIHTEILGHMCIYVDQKRLAPLCRASRIASIESLYIPYESRVYIFY